MAAPAPLQFSLNEMMPGEQFYGHGAKYFSFDDLVYLILRNNCPIVHLKTVFVLNSSLFDSHLQLSDRERDVFVFENPKILSSALRKTKTNSLFLNYTFSYILDFQTWPSLVGYDPKYTFIYMIKFSDNLNT